MAFISSVELIFRAIQMIVLSLDYQVWFLWISLGSKAICHFSCKSFRKEKNMIFFTHEQNIICSKAQSETQLDDIVQERTIIF